MRSVVPALLFTVVLQAQWSLQESHTTAGLRGVNALADGVVWASGANGTVLRTTDDGQTWQTCATPPNAGALDFRGIQGFDKNTAVVMSSGKGDLSRLYRTNDGCATWQLVMINPDAEGFWDAVRFSKSGLGLLIGDPVRGRLPVFVSADQGATWRLAGTGIATDGANQSLFAASNSALLIDDRGRKFYVVTGGGTTALISSDLQLSSPPALDKHSDLAAGEAAGGFSIASRENGSNLIIVAAGGDYKLPDASAGTAATWTINSRNRITFHAPQTLPHGYRSAVAWDAVDKIWIAVGINGTDVSTDDGRNWHALKPAANEPPDADRNWNALSLPFAVGPHGRIGRRGKQGMSRSRRISESLQKARSGSRSEASP